MQLGGTGSLMWGMVFGAVGLGYLTYGHRQRQALPLAVGVALCAVPYVVTNTPLLLAAGAALAALPFLLRRFG